MLSIKSYARASPCQIVHFFDNDFSSSLAVKDWKLPKLQLSNKIYPTFFGKSKYLLLPSATANPFTHSAVPLRFVASSSRLHRSFVQA